MASTTILSDNGVSSGSAGLKETGGNDGVLILQTTTSGGTATNAVYVDNTQQIGLGLTTSTWNTAGGGRAIQLSNSAGRASALASWYGAVGLMNDCYYGADNNFKYYSGAVPAIYSQAAGAHSWQSAGTGTAGTTISFTNILSGEKDKSLALQGATSATGTGITFPATQSASTDANTLDDYEEGTFTPFFSGSTGATYVASTCGYYQKVGKRVNFCAVVVTSALSSSGSPVLIGGLPFTIANLSSEYYEPACFFIQNGFTKTGILGYQPLLGKSSTTLQIWGLAASSGANYVSIVYSDLSASSFVRVTGSYFATA